MTEAGISRGSLKHLVDTGVIERAARGVYQLADVWDDEVYHLQVRYKKEVFSGETALYLHNLGKSNTNKISNDISNSYNLTNAKSENVKCNRVIKNFMNWVL